MPKLLKSLEKSWKKQDIETFLENVRTLETDLARLKKFTERMREIYQQLGDDLKVLEKALKNKRLKQYVKEVMGKPKLRSLEKAVKYLKEMKFDKVAAVLTDLALEKKAPTALKQLKEKAERVAEAHATLEKLGAEVDKIIKNWW